MMSFGPTSTRLRGLLLSLLWLGALPLAQARPRPYYPVPGHEKPVALLHAGTARYLVTEHRVFRLEGARFVARYQSSAAIQCAALADTVLWLGTAHGVLRLGTHGFRPRPVPFPLPDAAPAITALFLDQQGTPWVGAYGMGVFRWVNGAFVSELRTPAVNAGAATADGSVWVATSIGLSRKLGTEWARYNEEGVANHEIPDNIVEKLLPDNAGNLWVVMSDAICVFDGRARHAAAEAELPTVKFIGRSGNEVYGVASIGGVGRVFATAMGLLLLPDAPLEQAFAPSTDRIEPKRVLVPLPLPAGAANPTLLEVDARQRVWLASENGVLVLSAKAFRRFVSAKPLPEMTLAQGQP